MRGSVRSDSVANLLNWFQPVTQTAPRQKATRATKRCKIPNAKFTLRFFLILNMQHVLDAIGKVLPRKLSHELSRNRMRMPTQQHLCNSYPPTPAGYSRDDGLATKGTRSERGHQVHDPSLHKTKPISSCQTHESFLGCDLGELQFHLRRQAWPLQSKFSTLEMKDFERLKPPSRSRCQTSFISIQNKVAGRQGFEPWERSHVQRFSRPPHSTTLPPPRSDGGLRR